MNIFEKLKKRKGLKLIGQSLGFLMSEKFLRLILGFFVTAWVSRQLGPEDYGSYIFVTQYVMIFMPFVTFGMNEIMSRDIVKSESSEGEILGTSLVLKLINSAVGIFLVFLSFYFVEIDLAEKELIYWLTGLLFIHAFSLVDHWYEAHLKYKVLVFARNFGYLFGVSCKLAALFFELPFQYFVAIYAIEFILIRILNLFFYFKLNSKVKWSFSRSLFVSYFKEALPLFVVAAVTILEQKISFILLKEFQTKEVLGQFSLAFIVFNTLYFLPNAIVTTLYPTIIKNYNSNYKKYQYRTNILISTLLWMGVLVFVGFNTVGGYLFLLIFGEQYESAVEVMRWMAILSIFIFFDAGRKKILVLENAGREYLFFIIIFGGSSISLQYFLVQNYSYKGIIGGAFGAYIFANIISIMIGPKIRYTTIQLLKGVVLPFKEFKKRSLK